MNESDDISMRHVSKGEEEAVNIELENGNSDDEMSQPLSNFVSNSIYKLGACKLYIEKLLLK